MNDAKKTPEEILQERIEALGPPDLSNPWYFREHARITSEWFKEREAADPSFRAEMEELRQKRRDKGTSFVWLDKRYQPKSAEDGSRDQANNLHARD